MTRFMPDVRGWWVSTVTRWLCIRRGHSLLCTPDGHCCQRCGGFWANLERGSL